MSNEYLEEHKELAKKIRDCKCKAVTEGYCSHCEIAVVDFMAKFGAGSLCQDVRVERLEKENKCLNQEVKRLDNLRFDLGKKVNKLKTQIKTFETG